MKSEDKIVSVLWYQPFDPSEADVVVMNGVRKIQAQNVLKHLIYYTKNQILLWDIKLLGVALLVSIFLLKVL